MRKLAITALALLAGTTAASAGTIQIVPDMNAAYYKMYLTNVSVSTDGGVKYLNNVVAGQYRVMITGGTDPLAIAGDLLTYCLETAERLNKGTGMVEPLKFGNDSAGGLGAERASEIAQIFGRYQADLTKQLDKVHGTAIALAIWEIADEKVGGPLDLLSGNFRVKDTASADEAIDLAQTYLDSLTENGPVLTNLHAITIPKYQDIIIHNGGINIVVPEPGMVGLLGLGAFGLVAARRRARG